MGPEPVPRVVVVTAVPLLPFPNPVVSPKATPVNDPVGVAAASNKVGTLTVDPPLDPEYVKANVAKGFVPEPYDPCKLQELAEEDPLQ